MAGPPQLSDPRFKQFSEAGKPDTGTGAAVEAALTGAANVVATDAQNRLRDEVSAERDKFNQMMSELGSDSDVRLGVPSGGQDLVDLSIDNVIDNATAQETITVDSREIAAATAEIRSVQNAVDQGLMPTRALEINVEAITRRYIDRYPGLTQEFQQVAQTALGTSNNLLTSTMRAYEELYRAAASAQDDTETMAERAFEDGFRNALVGATPEIRATSLANWLSWAQLEEANRLEEARAEQAALLGLPDRSQALLANTMANASRELTYTIGESIQNIMPEGEIFSGMSDVERLIPLVDPAQSQEIIFQLETQREVVKNNLRQRFMDNVAFDDRSNAQLQSMESTIDTLYGTLIDSFSNKRVSEELGYYLSALESYNGVRFEVLFGDARVFYKNFLQFVPVDSNLHNLVFRNRLEHDLIERIERFYGMGNPAAVIAGSNTPMDEQEIEELTNAVDRAAINSFQQWLDNPNDEFLAEFPHQRYLNGMVQDFADMPADTKKEMLDMIGTPEFEAYAAQAANDPAVNSTIRELDRQVREWGEIMLDSAVEQFQRDITSESISRRFGVFRLEATPVITPSIAGASAGTSVVRDFISVGDLLEISRGPNGIRVARKPNSELAALGIDPNDQEMLQRVSNLTTAVNNNLILGLNAYARSMGNLGTGSSRDAILNQIIEDLIGEDTSKEGEE